MFQGAAGGVCHRTLSDFDGTDMPVDADNIVSREYVHPHDVVEAAGGRTPQDMRTQLQALYGRDPEVGWDDLGDEDVRRALVTFCRWRDDGLGGGGLFGKAALMNAALRRELHIKTLTGWWAPPPRHG